MIPPETLDFPPLHCSLDRKLGDYYQDFSGALVLVESEGHLDRTGVPLVAYGRHGLVHSAVVTAQYAIANLTALGRGDEPREARVRTQLDWLVEAQEPAGSLAGCWVMGYDNPKYPWLRAPWTSALACGHGVSALLRGWERFGDDRYKEAAQAAYDALHRTGTQLAIGADTTGELWYEEYPAHPPLHVLNGHVYALFGVVDFARATGDPLAHDRWRRAGATLLTHLDEFDLGFWSAYDLRWREPVSRHYQKNIHVPQLRILARLTDECRFADMADRWDHQRRSVVDRARWQLSMRAHRWRKQFARPAHDDSEVSLRAYPYPYRAALAICNDADFLTPTDFRRLHSYLATREDTEWGRGLGLDLGGSFFMFHSPDSPNRFTVFDGLTSTLTEHGEFILGCARRGVLDVLHTYGCFTDPSHFTRAMAETALSALDEHGVRISTWVNHGPPTNVQCLGEREEWQGDAVGSPGYHADLTIEHGIRWIWTGSEMVDRVAIHELTEPYVLRDGNQVSRFRRFAGLGGDTPVLDDLPNQLSTANLDALVASHGRTVVYQHLSVRRARPGFGTGAYGRVSHGWFKPAELAALRELSQRHHSGEIWVAPTSRILRHDYAQRALCWSLEREDGDRVVVIKADGCDREDLADVTFYCDEPEKAIVRYGADTIDEIRANAVDHTGRRSFTLLPSTWVPQA